MPRFIIITENSTELLDGTLADLQRRIKTLTEITGKVPIWSQTGPKQNLNTKDIDKKINGPDYGTAYFYFI